MILISLLLAVLISSASNALAVYGAPYWTTDNAESTIFNSKWADWNNIVDISCQGNGRHHLDTTGEPAYNSFRCQFQVTHYFDRMGSFICYGNARFDVVTATRFIVSGVEGLYTDGSVDNCDPNTPGSG